MYALKELLEKLLQRLILGALIELAHEAAANFEGVVREAKR